MSENVGLFAVVLDVAAGHRISNIIVYYQLVL